MEPLIKLLTIVLLLSSAITKSSSTADEDAEEYSGTEETVVSGGPKRSRFLAQKIPANYTCNKFPRVCRLKGSPGRDCCKKKCVNVKTDRLNCGRCGHKCRYNEICCKKKCVNYRFDRKNCGGCGIKCRKGDACAYGMCSYA